MLSKVGPDKRTFRDDAQAFTVGGVESGFDQDVAEMPAAERQRNLRMNEYQAVGRPLVVEERHLTVHRELESVWRRGCRSRERPEAAGYCSWCSWDGQKSRL